jgi:RNA polymerase sigma-70 factor (ECF subfamily)
MQKPNAELNADSLIPRALAGEREAFCELARQHEARLYRQAFGLCRNQHLAEDLAQETLIEAWKGLARYNGACRFSTWLYAILLHRHQKSLRKNRSVLRLFLGMERRRGSSREWELSAGADGDPAETACRAEAAEKLRADIEALPEDAREVIRLRFFAGASLSEISTALDIPLGTAKSRLHYALIRLREMCDPQLNPSAPNGDLLSEGRT